MTVHARYPARLARRLAGIVAAAALAAFAVIGSSVAWQEHRQLQAAAWQAGRASIEAVRVPLSQAAWEVDEPTMLLLLRPLVQSGTLVELRVRDGVGELARAQRPGAATVAQPTQRWQTELKAAQEPGRIAAVLEVTEAPLPLGSWWRERLPVLLAGEALKVALVAALVLALLQRQIIRPLQSLADGVENLGARSPQQALALHRPGGVRGDELDRLVDTINALHARLLAAFDERRQAESRERAEATQRAAILASVADGVLAFDRRGHLLYMNEAAQTLLSLEGTHLEDALRSRIGEHFEQWRVWFAEVRADSQSAGGVAAQRFVRQMRRRDGSTAPADITVQALPEGPLGFIVTLRDLSAEQAAERAQAESRAARAADQAKSRFLSRMSHELRTPLHAVLGLADVLAAGAAAGPLQPAQQDLLLQLRKAGAHLLSLIADLLDLSRIEAGELAMQVEPQPLLPVLRESLDLMENLAVRQGVSLHLMVDQPPTGRLLGAAVDATRLRQVLINLVSNAIKYNRAGGKVWLRLRALNEATLELEVEDDGVGMNEQQLSRLFIPFERGGRERSGIEGTGIGLVIARQLVERMGGRLTCASSPASGTRFTAVLSRADVDSAWKPAQLAVSDGSAPPLGRGRVLVVEDEAVNRLLVELYLKQRPEVDAVFAATLDEALATTGTFDLALIDLNLERHTGLDVRERLRDRWQAQDLPMPRWIVYSADTADAQRQAALAAGFDEYWIKPLALDEFLRRLDAALKASASHRP